MIDIEEEKRVTELYRQMSDEELLNEIRKKTEELGHPPRKEDMAGVRILKSRFGPWPRLLERAGVKPISEARKRKIEAGKCRSNQSEMADQ